MSNRNRKVADSTSASPNEAVDHLRNSLQRGRPWPTALLEAMALWTSPQETRDGRPLNYFIGGEAFDWLLLAERMLSEVDGLVPEEEKEELLFTGRFPGGVDKALFKKLLGVDKYRGHLNYHYGVIVEQALQLATEQEVHKRYASKGMRYKEDASEEAFVKIYHASRSDLLKQFLDEKGYGPQDSLSLSEVKEFTYWLFKYRLKNSDKARIASDTTKGLEHLQRMGSASTSHPSLT